MTFLRILIFSMILFLCNPLESKQTVCLNMIVKNETPVIKRCLDSARPMIDYWVIVDTGSTDGSQKMIKEILKDIPGELHERPWVNFEHNRNQALELAKGKADYVLFIDADEYFSYAPNFHMPELNKDFYYINISYGSLQYARSQLINNHLDWRWKGVLHEVLTAKPEDEPRSHELLNSVTTIVTAGEGARSKDPNKYQKDAALLEEALKKEPNNQRYVFYLARSYKDYEAHALALKNFEKRVSMGGWDEEVFESLLEIGRMHQLLGSDHDTIVSAYNKAYTFRPSRVEPLFLLTKYLMEKKDYKRAYEVAKIGSNIPLSKDVLFVQPWLYKYGMKLEFSVAAYWLGRYEESQQISQELLKLPDLSPETRALIESNLAFANLKLFLQPAA